MDPDQTNTEHEVPSHGEFSEQLQNLRRRDRLTEVHSNRFPCPDCGRIFRVKIHLARHVLAHHDKKLVYKCPFDGCERTYRRRYAWKTHLSMCTKLHGAEQQDKSPAVTTTQDPSMTNTKRSSLTYDFHEDDNKEGTPSNTRITAEDFILNGPSQTNPIAKPSEALSTKNDNTSCDRQETYEGMSDNYMCNTPPVSPAEHPPRLGFVAPDLSCLVGYDIPDISAASVHSTGGIISWASDEYNPFGQDLSRTQAISYSYSSFIPKPMEPLPSKKFPAIEESVGNMEYTTEMAANPGEPDGLFRDSTRMRDTQWNPPENSIREFIALFGEMLIQRTGAKRWMEHTLVQHPSEEIEKLLSSLLKDYAVKMIWSYFDPRYSHLLVTKRSNPSPTNSWTLLDDTAWLIGHCRKNIADYFCNNSTGGPTIAASLVGSLIPSTQQRSVMRWYTSFEKSKFSQKGSQRTSDVTNKKNDGLDENRITEEEDVPNEFNFVKDTLISDEAFRWLASELRQNFDQDDRYEMESISQTVASAINGLHKLPPIIRFVFRTSWNPLDFMHAQYGEIIPIASVVVLTGSAFHAQATTCGEYLRATWPTVGPILLDILDRSLASEDRRYVTVDPVLDDCSPRLEMKVHRSGACLHVSKPSQEFVTELAQSLAWIGSALSTSPFGDDLAYVQPILQDVPPRRLQRKYERPKFSKFALNLDFKYTVLRATETACWLPLFKGASIASGFPIPERAGEIGLEVPLELLAALCGVRQAIEFEGGIVLKGFGEMLVPVKKIADRIQWHAIISEDSENRLTYGEGLSRCQSRALLDEVSFDDLKTTRAIVGWCCAATSRLGSDAANYENIDYSGAKEAGSGLRCAGGQIGIQQIGTGILDFKLGAKDGNFHVPRLGRYQKIVSASDRTPIVLYGTKEQRGWLVFASDVLLHMIQHRHYLDPFEVEGKPVRLDTTVTARSSAKSVLMNYEKVRISDEQDYTFKDLVVEIWATLESLIDQNTRRGQNMSGAPVKASFREFLQGYEYKAVVEDRSPFTLKEQELCKTSGGWPLLVRDVNALVLFADGFGEVILPTEYAKSNLCRLWHSVPSNSDYLATTSKVLKDLYSVAGCRITRKYLTSTQLRWHRGESLVFEACTNTGACRCDRLQQIIPKASIGTIVPPGFLADEGAVIFGQGGSFMQELFSTSSQKPIQITGIYSQPNVPLRSLELHNNLEDALSSENFSRTGSDGVADFISASLSSSCTALSTHIALSESAELNENTKPIMSSKRRLYPANSSTELSDEHRESYKAFERMQSIRAGKRRQCMHAESSGSRSYEV